MNQLPFAPLPFENSDVAKSYRRAQSESFVDEAVVLSVIAKGPYERDFVKSEDMALSSSEDDFAGWALPVVSPFRSFLDIQNPEIVAEVQRPCIQNPNTKTTSSEVGLSEPYQGSHRWWLFGLATAMICSVLSLTLLSLAQREPIAQMIPSNTPTSQKLQKVHSVKTGEIAPPIVKILTTD